MLLERHAPPTKRYIRANPAPYLNKILNQAVMLRTHLRNKYLCNRNEATKKHIISNGLIVCLLLEKKKENIMKILILIS